MLVSAEQEVRDWLICAFLQVQYYLQLAQQHQQALQATGAGGMQILQQGIPNAAGLQTIQLVQAPQASMQVIYQKFLLANYIITLHLTNFNGNVFN